MKTSRPDLEKNLAPAASTKIRAGSEANYNNAAERFFSRLLERDWFVLNQYKDSRNG